MQTSHVAPVLTLALLRCARGRCALPGCAALALDAAFAGVAMALILITGQGWRLKHTGRVVARGLALKQMQIDNCGHALETSTLSISLPMQLALLQLQLPFCQGPPGFAPFQHPSRASLAPAYRPLPRGEVLTETSQEQLRHKPLECHGDSRHICSCFVQPPHGA